MELANSTFVEFWFTSRTCQFSLLIHFLTMVRLPFAFGPRCFGGDPDNPLSERIIQQRALMHERRVSMWRHFARRLRNRCRRISVTFNTTCLQKHHIKQFTILNNWDRFVWLRLEHHRFQWSHLDPFGLLAEAHDEAHKTEEVVFQEEPLSASVFKRMKELTRVKTWSFKKVEVVEAHKTEEALRLMNQLCDWIEEVESQTKSESQNSDGASSAGMELDGAAADSDSDVELVAVATTPMICPLCGQTFDDSRLALRHNCIA